MNTELNFASLEIIHKNSAQKFAISNTKILEFLNKLSASKITSPISYLFFLNPASRYIADIFLIEKDNRIFMVAPLKILLNLIEHIKKFDLRKELEFIKTNYHIYYTNDKQTSYKDPRHTNLGQNKINATDNIKEYTNNQTLYKDPRHANLGYFELTTNKIDATCSMQEYKKLLIENNIAEFNNFEHERSIILEFGQISQFISHEKGCYPGQELMHRTHASGEIRKTVGLIDKNDQRIVRVLEENSILQENANKIFALYKICM